MCGRFIQYSDPQVYADQFGLEPDTWSAVGVVPRYNLAPGQPVLAVRIGTDGRRRLDPLRWGLIPAWSLGPDNRFSMINARAETVAGKPAYRAAFRARRCLIPTEGFYEWQALPGGKHPYLIHRTDRRPFAMAGLWEHWPGRADRPAIASCAIIVTAANAAIGAIHDRMPVILSAADWARWLDPGNRDGSTLRDLLRSAPPEDWTLTPVSRRVNSARIDDPDLILPAAPEETPVPTTE